MVAVRSTISSKPITYRSAVGFPVTDPVNHMLMFSSIFFPLTFHVPSHNFKSLKVVYSGSLCVMGMDEEVRALHFLVDV